MGEKALQVKKMPSEGRNLAGQTGRHRGRGGGVSGARFQGEGPEHLSRVPQGRGREGQGSPSRGNASAGQGVGASGGQRPRWAGLRQQVCLPAGPGGEAGAGPGPGAAQRDSRGGGRPSSLRR